METKKLIKFFCDLFELPSVNWAVQTKLAKKLLDKHSYDELCYALEYYKSKGVAMYSLGYLTAKDALSAPLDLYKAEKAFNLQDGDSGERNKQRCIRKDNETNFGEEYYFDLFKES